MTRTCARSLDLHHRKSALVGRRRRFPPSPADKFCIDIPTWDELVERIIMLGYIYSLTGLTGHCKTALLALLMVAVGTRKYFLARIN